MRLFIAVDLSIKANEEIKRVQDLIIDRNVIGSKVASFHLTLKFLGEVKEEHLSKIVDKLKQIKVSEIKLKLNNLGVFPNKELVRVIWVGFEENYELKRLHEDIKETLHEFTDVHKFHPHLTLARVKFIKDKLGFAEKLEKTKTEPIESKITSFSLYKSTLTPKGPIYEKINEFSTS